jgi:hypothetical protein
MRSRQLAEEIFQTVSNQYSRGAPNVFEASIEVRIIANFWKGIEQYLFNLLDNFITSLDLQQDNNLRINLDLVEMLLTQIIKALSGDIYHLGDCTRQLASCYLEAIHRGG